MSPMLRGETAPVPASALAGARERLAREWGHENLATPAGPLLLIRVPATEPDLLRDLEGAAEALPRLDLAGYRGCILVGDRAHLGVSPDMLGSLIASRGHAEDAFVATHRVQMAPWAFKIARLPSDAQRRLRCLVRVDATRVAELKEADFDRLGAMLAAMKRASPGQVRPHWVHLIAHEDAVRIDGARFFTELEQRAARLERRVAKRDQEERERKHEIARANLDRILERRSERPPPRPRDRPPYAAVPRVEPRTIPRVMPPPIERPQPPAPRAAPSPISDPLRQGTMPRPPPLPATAPTPPRDARFAAADAHPGELEHLKRAFTASGYEIRERLVVQDVPLVLAAARPEGYPRRVVVSFWRRLDPETARRLLQIGKGVGAELVLAIAEVSEEGVERVTVATNLKVITPDAVRGLRLD